jgi:hypothetical protein
MPFPCHALADPLPYRAAKGLDYVFPIWFTQCGHVWFTYAMLRPCHATTMSFWKRLLKATVQHRHGMACVKQYRPSRDGIWVTCLSSASSGYQTEFNEGCYQKHTNPLNCRTSISDISGYLVDFHEGHSSVREWQGRRMAWHGMAGEWHGHSIAYVN